MSDYDRIARMGQEIHKGQQNLCKERRKNKELRKDIVSLIDKVKVLENRIEKQNQAADFACKEAEYWKQKYLTLRQSGQEYMEWDPMDFPYSKPKYEHHEDWVKALVDDVVNKELLITAAFYSEKEGDEDGTTLYYVQGGKLRCLQAGMTSEEMIHALDLFEQINKDLGL